MFITETVLVIGLLVIQVHCQHNAAYCDNGLCSSPDKYCCGPNECCDYVWTSWYIWIVFVSGILIIGFLVWKYHFQNQGIKFITVDSIEKMNDQPGIYKKNGGSHHHHATNNRSMSSSSSSSSMLPYLPLNNDQVFYEQQIDENTIHFNLVKSNNNNEYSSQLRRNQ